MSSNSGSPHNRKKSFISLFRKPKSPTNEKLVTFKTNDVLTAIPKRKFFDKRRAKSIEPGDEYTNQAKEFSKRYDRNLSVGVDALTHHRLNQESISSYSSLCSQLNSNSFRSSSGHIGPDEFVQLVRQRRNSDVDLHTRKIIAQLNMSAVHKHIAPTDPASEETQYSPPTPSITVSDFDEHSSIRAANFHNADRIAVEQQMLVNEATVSSASLPMEAIEEGRRSPHIQVYTRNRPDPPPTIKPNRSGLLAAVKNHMAGRRASINPLGQTSAYKTSRRYSQPEIPSLVAVAVAGGEQRQRRDSSHLGDTFNNFPHITSNNSASRELSRYCPSSGHYIIWKEKNKIERIIRISTSNNGDENADDILTEPFSDDIFKNLLDTKSIYDAMVSNSRLVIVDINIQVKSVFYVFNFEKIKSAPLWEGANNVFKGMLTVTDLINILLNFTGENFKDELPTIETDTVSKWRDILLEGRESVLVKQEIDVSLSEGYEALRKNNIHRLLVTNRQGEALHILTKRKILHYLYKMYGLYRTQQPVSFMGKSIQELKIGTYENLASASEDRPLREVLRLLFDRRVSCLPILDPQRHVINIYQKADVMHLVLLDIINTMDKPIGEILKQGRPIFEGVYCCKQTHSFVYVLETIMKFDVHRLMVVDDDRVLVGIVSISDILQFLAQSSNKEIKEINYD